VHTTSSDDGRKAAIFWGMGLAWVVLDVITKRMAVSSLDWRVPTEVIGDWVRFTLVYNRGAAFGMHVGEWSRWIFTFLTIGALVMLAFLYRETRPDQRMRLFALTLVSGGAMGNLIDRLRGSQGVVDFIDVGIGNVWRFWTFNVADIGVSCGAVMLAVALWQEDRDVRTASEHQRVTAPPEAEHAES
jgi:signal peptidase II